MSIYWPIIALHNSVKIMHINALYKDELYKDIKDEVPKSVHARIIRLFHYIYICGVLYFCIVQYFVIISTPLFHRATVEELFLYNCLIYEPVSLCSHVCFFFLAHLIPFVDTFKILVNKHDKGKPKFIYY